MNRPEKTIQITNMASSHYEEEDVDFTIPTPPPKMEWRLMTILIWAERRPQLIVGCPIPIGQRSFKPLEELRFIIGCALLGIPGFEFKKIATNTSPERAIRMVATDVVSDRCSITTLQVQADREKPKFLQAITRLESIFRTCTEKNLQAFYRLHRHLKRR